VQGKVLEHPVLKALAAVMDDVKLTKRRFTRLIEARVSPNISATAFTTVVLFGHPFSIFWLHF
jgi:hypothetical protein